MLDMHRHDVYMIVLSKEHVGRFLKLIPSDHTQDGQMQVKQESEHANGVVMKSKGASRLHSMEVRVYLKWVKERESESVQKRKNEKKGEREGVNEQEKARIDSDGDSEERERERDREREREREKERERERT